MTEHKIGWLNMPGYKPETWNPIVGCSKVSPGCDNCYAEKMAFRLLHMPFTDYYAFVMDDNRKGDPEEFRYIPKCNGKTHLVKQALNRPLSWKEPRMIFVCSMGDLFHESTNFSSIDRVFEVMNKCPQHIFILLTKRPENAVKYLVDRLGSLSNISKKEDGNTWWGVTAENQEQANKRIPILLQIPAAKLFVSIEPMLGPVDVTDIKYFNAFYGDIKLNSLKGYTMYESINSGMPCFTDCEKLDWVICGGETGHKARQMHPDWVRSLRDQCKAADVPFFFKQWGEWLPFGENNMVRATALDKHYNYYEFVMGDGSVYSKKVISDSPKGHDKSYFRFGRKENGNLLDGKQHHNCPQLEPLNLKPKTR